MNVTEQPSLDYALAAYHREKEQCLAQRKLAQLTEALRTLTDWAQCHGADPAILKIATDALNQTHD